MAFKILEPSLVTKNTSNLLYAFVRWHDTPGLSFIVGWSLCSTLQLKYVKYIFLHSRRHKLCLTSTAAVLENLSGGLQTYNYILFKLADYVW